MMPTKTTNLCKKGVVISIYVEKPRRNVSTKKHYYVHHTIKHQNGNNNNNIASGNGHNRRAELLLYSRRLRESARPNSLVSSILSPTTNVNAVQKKPKHMKKAPTCPINWKILNFSCCRSLTSVQINKGNKKNKRDSPVKSVIESLKVTKKKGFISKFLSMFQKGR